MQSMSDKEKANSLNEVRILASIKYFLEVIQTLLHISKHSLKILLAHSVLLWNLPMKEISSTKLVKRYTTKSISLNRKSGKFLVKFINVDG